MKIKEVNHLLKFNNKSLNYLILLMLSNKMTILIEVYQIFWILKIIQSNYLVIDIALIK
jgi:hypothetical protein